MAITSGKARPEGDPYRRIAERAFGVDQYIERVRQKATAAQRSAAASMRKSAESQDRIAKMYQDRAEHGLFHADALDRDDDLEHAARHRQFAQDDRRMAERLHQIADEHRDDTVRHVGPQRL
jgi:hypothetical protein